MNSLFLGLTASDLSKNGFSLVALVKDDSLHGPCSLLLSCLWSQWQRQVVPTAVGPCSRALWGTRVLSTETLTRLWGNDPRKLSCFAKVFRSLNVYLNLTSPMKCLLFILKVKTVLPWPCFHSWTAFWGKWPGQYLGLCWRKESGFSCGCCQKSLQQMAKFSIIRDHQSEAAMPEKELKH